VTPPASSAPRWAAASIPTAPPLTVRTPATASPRQARRQPPSLLRSDVGSRRRDPMVASAEDAAPREDADRRVRRAGGTRGNSRGLPAQRSVPPTRSRLRRIWLTSVFARNARSFSDPASLRGYGRGRGRRFPFSR
jgi:hypothetical protein